MSSRVAVKQKPLRQASVAKSPRYTRKPKEVVKVSKFADIIYDKIIKSFNVSYLSKLEGNNYAYVKKKLIDRSETFERLIDNFESEYPPAKFISGPQTFITMTHHTKQIILIGERHNTVEDCGSYFYRTNKNFYDYESGQLLEYDYDTAMELSENGMGDYVDPMRVVDALIGVMMDGIAFVDLFAEQDFFDYLSTGKVYDNEDRISAIVRSAQQSDIGRVHLSDVRGSSQLSKLSPEERKKYDPNLDYSIALEVLINGSFDMSFKKRYAKIFKDLHSYLFDLKLTDDEWRERMMAFILDNTYLKKEIERSYLGKVIYSYYIDRIRNDDLLQRRGEYSHMEDVYQELDDLVQKGKKLSNEARMKLVMLDTDYILFNTPIFDMYTLARIFKTFKGLDTDRPKEPTNVVIYSGALHSDSIAGFLERIGFDRVNGRQISENCLYTGLKEPFFFKG